MPAYQFGVPVLPLSQIVDELDIAQGNTKRHRAMANFVHARWVYKELLWKTIWGIVQKVVTIDNIHPEGCGCRDVTQICPVPVNQPKETAITQKIHSGTIKLPKDLIRLINISVMDKCGEQQPLAYNPYINTVDMSCGPVKCSCPNCGGNATLCQVLDEIKMTTESIDINGTTYTKYTWIRKDDRGDLLEVSDVPTWNADTDTVETVTLKKLLCNLDVDQSGCIKYTEPNRIKLARHCGCYIPWIQYDLCANQCQTGTTKNTSQYGEFNWDAKAGDVIQLKHVKADRVIIAYQPSGESPDTEILVPEYAVEAMLAGISHRQKWISPVFSLAEKQMARQEWILAKNNLYDFMNPVKMSEIMEIASLRPRWRTITDGREGGIWHRI